jgi:hypothetical protein
MTAYFSYRILAKHILFDGANQSRMAARRSGRESRKITTKFLTNLAQTGKMGKVFKNIFSGVLNGNRNFLQCGFPFFGI